MKNKKSENFLECIYEKNQKYRWETDENGKVTIFVENKGFFNTLMQKLINKPRFSQVHLEEFGSFLWPLIDGRNTVEQLGSELKNHFGDKAEPLYPRLVQYMKMLLNYSFVKKTENKTEEAR